MLILSVICFLLKKYYVIISIWYIFMLTWLIYHTIIASERIKHDRKWLIKITINQTKQTEIEYELFLQKCLMLSGGASEITRISCLSDILVVVE